MAPSIGEVTNYVAEIQKAHDAEVIGEALFMQLAANFGGDKAEKLRIVARLEKETGILLDELMSRHGIERSSSSHFRDEVGEELLGKLSGLSWSELLGQLADDLRPFVETYDRLASEAPPADRIALSFLAHHERCLCDFFAAEADGSGDVIVAEIQQLTTAIKAAQTQNREH